MIRPLKLSSLVFIVIFLSQQIWAQQLLPDQFTMEYELKQSDQNVGKMFIQYKSQNKKYSLRAVTEGEGFLKLLGNRELLSEGLVTSKGFSPRLFAVKNIKRPNKDINGTFNIATNKINIQYRGEESSFDLKPRDLDLAVYLYQFNYEKKGQEIYRFNVLEGKRIREYEYKKIRDEVIDISAKKVAVELYEGQILEKEDSIHYVWVSKGKYRVPVKLRVMTDVGLLIDQTVVRTSLAL
jgi:hypothetical protein